MSSFSSYQQNDFRCRGKNTVYRDLKLIHRLLLKLVSAFASSVSAHGIELLPIFVFSLPVLSSDCLLDITVVFC